MSQILTPEQLVELRVQFEDWEISRLHEPSSYDKITYLAREGDGYSRYGVHCDWLAWQAASISHQSRIAELEALSDDLLNTLNFERGQRVELEKDAARYRWLRRDYGKSHIHVVSYSIENETGDLLMGADCDYAIDMVMEDSNANN